MPQIFISYSRKDNQFAKQLSKSLGDKGFTVWIDLAGISAGSKWSQAIQEALDETSIMIVIISPDSMASPNVTDEWQYYLDQKKSVVPVLLEPAKIHFQLNRIQYIDFHTQGYDSAFEQLTREIQLKLDNVQQQPSALITSTRQDKAATRNGSRRSSLLFGFILFIASIVVLLSRSFLTKEQSPTFTPQPEITFTPKALSSNEGGNQLPAELSTSDSCPTVALVPTSTGINSFKIRVKNDFANLRCAPGKDYPAQATAIRDQIYEALAQAQGFGQDGNSVTWYLITYSGHQLWISSEVVEIVVPNTGTSDVRNTPPPPPTLPGGGCADNCG